MSCSGARRVDARAREADMRLWLSDGGSGGLVQVHHHMNRAVGDAAWVERSGVDGRLGDRRRVDRLGLLPPPFSREVYQAGARQRVLVARHAARLQQQ